MSQTTTSAAPTPDQAPPSTKTLANLRRLNLIAGFAHLAQMVAILLLTNSFSLPVTASYLEGPPGTPPTATTTLFETRVGWAVALFFGLSALFHFLVASPMFFGRYAAGLLAHHNYFRWVEYSISSSVMIVIIAQICGIADVAALLAIFGVNASMILFGWLQEKYENPGGGMLPFVFGCLAGITPWIVVAVMVISPGSTGDGETPGFVYGIIVSLFVLFNSFALVQYLQYKPVGKWSDYLRGERAYIILSLVAKSLLAWQIFANTLIPQ